MARQFREESQRHDAEGAGSSDPRREAVESKSVVPDFTPMRLAVRRDPFDHPDWIYELKLDGFRSFAVIEPGTCELDDRSLNNQTFWPNYVLIGHRLPEEAQCVAV